MLPILGLLVLGLLAPSLLVLGLMLALLGLLSWQHPRSGRGRIQSAVPAEPSCSV
jgi:hypothetical protein